MLKAIRDFVEKQIMAPAEGAQQSNDPEHALRLATAALLVEMSRQDESITTQERDAIGSSLREHFNLPQEEVDELYVLAEQEIADATDYHQFTSLLKDRLNPEQKEKVVELLWRIAIADGSIDSFEEHMVRRISDLLYVSHSAFVRAKHRAIG